ncbi:DUF2304 domain-containing protein [Paenibacillus sp. OSY-SE]|uniref:DUF2304 domain-containing protein n=1 Tax=Paenibacillus sp. OSY-SE TaxID=1196323 RepID=UPI00037EFD21|nr:DUF2304 domain-containing protein [Paenibacillus sp. OSY-SE]
MISLKLQVILIIASVICALILFNLIKKYRLELKYTMLWLILMFIILNLAIFPGLIRLLAKAMGIELPVNALFLLVSFSSFAILFSMTITASRSATKIKELSQELGLLKLEVSRLTEELRVKEKNK